MNRRNFIKGMAGILASGFAPAVVGSGVLMPVRKIITSTNPLFGGAPLVLNEIKVIPFSGDADGWVAMMQSWQREANRLTGIRMDQMRFMDGLKWR